ncbi:MAG: hypothetical protein JETT_3275 [Candidatus Jettenia ecosi]|uniref:Uncharacterized protein n=1 Tax=Candidatus Jettenia ecosi TaxID=2494326 RepID=A0A533Q764_9BACT|nr:MAG: hypothetical protein JETT_3275 [Candidatus Jettenia ecosi]
MERIKDTEGPGNLWRRILCTLTWGEGFSLANKPRYPTPLP